MGAALGYCASIQFSCLWSFEGYTRTWQKIFQIPFHFCTSKNKNQFRRYLKMSSLIQFYWLKVKDFLLHHYHLPRREKLLLIDDKSDNHLSRISVKHWRKKVQVQAPSVLFYLWMWQECPNGSSFTRKIVKFPPKLPFSIKPCFVGLETWLTMQATSPLILLHWLD